MDYEFVPGRDDFPPDEIAMLRQQLHDADEFLKAVERARLSAGLDHRSRPHLTGMNPGAG